jgi:hypothetical protein
MLVVAAGAAPPDAREAARVFVEAGGLLIDRKLEDAEIESLYTVSSVIWACYAPDYDQASGIFGRALQLGVPVIVRRGSVIERFSSGLTVPILALEFGNMSQGAALLVQDAPPRLSGQALNEHGRLIGSWRENFITTLHRSV